MNFIKKIKIIILYMEATDIEKQQVDDLLNNLKALKILCIKLHEKPKILEGIIIYSPPKIMS
jgi:hypothetical protein